MVLHFEQETTGYVLKTCVSDQGAIWGYCGRMGSYASLARFSYHQLPGSLSCECPYYVFSIMMV